MGIGIVASSVGIGLAQDADHADGAAAPDTNADINAPSPVPETVKGPADLAVAWWPQDIKVGTNSAGHETLRFQTSVANLGGQTAPLQTGDRIEYTVTRLGAGGVADAVVGHSSMPLTRADVQPFPTDFGEEVGHEATSFGRTLATIDALAPETAAILGSNHAGQIIDIGTAVKGEYLLRQQIVRADGSPDAQPFDDVRETHIFLDGAGGFLHASSAYAGDTSTHQMGHHSGRATL